MLIDKRKRKKPFKKNTILCLICSGCDGTASRKKKLINKISEKTCILILALVMIIRGFENTCDHAGMLLE